MNSVVVLFVSLLAGCLAEEAPSTSTIESSATCTPKGLLSLEKPFPAPGLQKKSLPFCSRFQCGCCGQRSVRVIARAVTEGWSDDSLPDACRGVLEQVYCSVCDPLVGSNSQPVCESTCSKWWHACKDAFFSLDGNGNLLPCGPSASGSRLICSELKSLAAGPKELCSMAGYTVSEKSDQECFNGTANTPPAMCAAPFQDPSPLPHEEGEEADSDSWLAMLSESDAWRMTLRGVMVLGLLTFIVKRLVVRHGQNARWMQQQALAQQRVRLAEQQRRAMAAAALARQVAAPIESKPAGEKKAD